MKNNLRQIDVILYRLERNLGRAIRIHNKKSTTQSVTLMTKTVVWETITVPKAIIMSAKEMRTFIAESPAAKSLEGLFNLNTRYVIIRGNKVLDISTDSVVEFDDLRYNVSRIDSAYENVGYMLEIKAIVGNPKVGQ